MKKEQYKASLKKVNDERTKNKRTNNQVKIGPSQHFLNFDSDADADAVADAEADADAELSNTQVKLKIIILLKYLAEHWLD